MIYLYAHTNHKSGLDSLRRVAAIYWQLEKESIACELLINDYRAQLTARSWGLPLATTIETIKDIDAVATPADTIVIDSTETLEGKVLAYPEKFKQVIYLNSLNNEHPFLGAENISLFQNSQYLFTQVTRAVSRKAIFIYGDSDYEKSILKNLEIFKDKELDLYWGTYFFVKYEDEMAKIFNNIVESEEYYNILQEYEYIISSSLQVAIESSLNGSKVLFLELESIDNFSKNALENLNIPIVKDLKTLEYHNRLEKKNIPNFSSEICSKPDILP